MSEDVPLHPHDDPPRPPPGLPVALPLTVDVTITALDHGGHGVGVADGGLAVRVPFVLPGERVRVRVWRHAPDGALADPLEVLAPAAERVAAACPLFGACGGCQLQHLPYAHQLDWKTTVVRTLAAPLGLSTKVAACIGSPRAFGYRSKITPHHDRPRADRPLAIGFLKAGRRHEVVDVERCPLATDAINARLPALRAEIAANAASGRRLGASFLLREATSGVTTDPDARVTEQVGGVALEFFAREFFQNNPFLLPRLLEFALDSAAAGGARFLVDAYAGSGLFALSAAPRFQEVVGVEVSAGAVVAARENAARNQLKNVRFVAADAARIFAQLIRAGEDTAVIVDPPRKGCGQPFLTQLVAFAPRTIVYVSCNPETMCRDLEQLMAAGYEVRTLQPFDMFPQTRHVECVTVLGRIPTAPAA
ncbi:MAG: class I SAM-dependent RNA methyltransferase [Pseudomonadota bacterium]